MLVFILRYVVILTLIHLVGSDKILLVFQGYYVLISVVPLAEV